MKNWSTDIHVLKKDKKQYAIWRLEQLVNFGLHANEKIPKTALKKYWNEIHIDPVKKKYLAFLLWNKQF
ncbi:MAG: hypothetical protein A2233_03110 [Candidatus Kerfeldbacteria bacterium RIFOXYA2_FULL_38_24]|uniref:Uncharacterized protein n=1 Tax=Candidatus Kerfeldbacteria bacterium RIFOXYB2_FULL_38_14 TaxID=1798547 RepID=A0A1G2BAZ3_9BACT|nr:MAG: hypothetical protein A2233_03110 [Candidatus Kerfeldbacteria bacterium RIFOXYA2_FULL_38_24]OGY86185.1 MAG: hypothetical protein A2319_03310 [Candidatus Kerfeldbacteria bacterium RIFOXYB2_FULL_38_14]OGY89625.1 MAG: hypothetical protein A2458_04020 [Candidatus Kerfeldbacteria bacterium RIFOXYC2_FULL_38_9]